VYKGLLIILDGLGDRPSPLLKGRTPLQAAHTPVMDGLVASGSCGLVDPLSAGFPVDTHTGSAALMGVARRDLLSMARGPVEAAGVGVDMNPGDILLRANFATLQDDGRTIIDRRAGRITQGTAELAQVLREVDLDDGITASVFPATQHRAVVRLRGENLSPDITDTDPGSLYPGACLLNSHALESVNGKARRTAQALNVLTREAFTRLSAHPLNGSLALPANALLARGAGIASTPDNLLNSLGLSTAVISGERTLHGLGRLLGFEVIYRKQFTAASDTDLAAKFEAVREALATHDIVYLHIKATDIFSHSRDAVGKQVFLEAIDNTMQIALEENMVIGITGDHSTDSNTGNHCGDPVPSLLYAPGCRIDMAKHFSEMDCIQGGLGRIEASGFLLSMLDLMGRLPNYHPFDAAFVDSFSRNS
jgi:2,3-bisphosphoglycerate-independent phosphoglycerate mutase